MIWIVQDNTSNGIVSSNIHYDQKTNMHQLWGTKPSDKSFLIKESKDEIEVVELKKAIDFAKEHKETVFRL